MAQTPVDDSFERVLQKLLDTIDCIFSDKAPDVNYAIETYSLIYDYCTTELARIGESRLSITATGRRKYLLRAGENKPDRIPGGEIYYNVENSLINHVKKLHELSENFNNEYLLRFYVDQWRKYQSSSDKLNRICLYLNRHWIRRVCDAGFRTIYEIFTLSILIWRENLWKSLKDKLTDASRTLIESHRLNQAGEIQFIGDIIKSYKAMDFPQVMYIWRDDSEIRVPLDDIYENYFEKPFIQDTERFYRSQAKFDFEHGTILEYLEKITPYINKDIENIYPYLLSSTQSQLMELFERVFFQDHLDMIYNEIDILIKKKDNQGLKVIYESIKHISITKSNIVNMIGDHFYQVAINAIEDVKEVAINNPRVYVETIFDAHKKFLTFVQENFNSDQYFVRALDKACGKFINNNAVTQKTGNTTKSCELLARYCDILLRKRNKAVQEIELDGKLNQIMIVFNYIEDKDAFLKFYEKMLAKRLIDQLSASDDYEVWMISKLKQTCGFEYTSKLEQMFKDISVSKTLTLEHGKYCENHHVTDIVDFSVIILSSNSWPFSVSLNVVLPIELKAACGSFTDFYTNRHSGRKLTWLHQHSKGELQTYFTSQKYTLQVSTYQMIVLLLFNKSLNWTVEQIQDETQIKSELLIQILCSLLQSKILVCADINEDSKEIDIRMNYTIKLTNDFKSEKLRINVNVPHKLVEQKSIADLNKTIDEERKMIIQAAIVRIMKAQQILKHSLLMQEVIQQLSSRFKPNIAVIKKCIDILIEKAYLERQSDEKDILRYLA